MIFCPHFIRHFNLNCPIYFDKIIELELNPLQFAFSRVSIQFSSIPTHSISISMDLAKLFGTRLPCSSSEQYC